MSVLVVQDSNRKTQKRLCKRSGCELKIKSRALGQQRDNVGAEASEVLCTSASIRNLEENKGEWMADRFRQWYVRRRQHSQAETTTQSTAQYCIVFALCR
jgi:hypothetical protein